MLSTEGNKRTSLLVSIKSDTMTSSTALAVFGSVDKISNMVSAADLHGQKRASCSRSVVSLSQNVVNRPHLKCVRAACCGLSSHGCYSLSSDLLQNCSDRTAAVLLGTDLLQTGVTELQQCCWKQNCARL